jgi:hypothetical protein
VISLLAYADNSDPTNSNFICVLICVAGTVVVGLLVAVLVVMARRRQHPYSQHIHTAAIFWGMIALGTIAYATATQLAWQKQYTQDLMSGYGNPREVGPGLPWVLWCALAAVYAALLGWTMLRKNDH